MASASEEGVPAAAVPAAEPGAGTRRAARVGVVLAAGRSRRLSPVTRAHSKAVLSFGGISLVERAVRSLRHAGMERVIVVVGYDAASVEECLADARVEVVHAADWEYGNGASLAATEHLVAAEDEIAVVCADSVFADGALDGLFASSSPAALIDPSPRPAVWDEGTRVRIESGAAVAFGKHLGDPAVDCGAFILPAAIFAAYRTASAKGDHSLAGAITEVSSVEPLRAVAIPEGSWWQDVDTPEDLKSARKVLRRSLAKDTDGIVSRKINRPISTRITVALAPLRLSPNLISVVTFVVGVWASWSLSAGRALQGAILVQLSSILDGSDGETARLQGRVSARGAAFDGFLDRMVDAAIYAGLALWMLDDPSRDYRIAVIAISMVAWGLVSSSLQDATSPFEIPRPDEPRWIGLLGGRDTRMLIIAGSSLLGLPLAAVSGAAALYVGSGLWRVFAVASGRHRKPRDVRAGATTSAPRAALAGVLRTIRIALFPIVVIAAFVVVLPRMVDLHEVWDLIRKLPWTAVVLLAALALWNLVTYWPFVMASMPGLSFWQAAVVCQSSTTVAMTVPAGGAVAVGVTYAIFSSWGFDGAAIAGSAMATFVVGTAIKLILPAVAFLALSAQGDPITGLASAAATGAVLLAVFALAFPLLLRGRRTGRLMGRFISTVVNAARRIFRMSPVEGLEARIAGFRKQLGGLLRDRWLGLSATGILSQLSIFAVMLVTLHVVGVAEQEVSWAEALAVFASVRLATSVPIVPGNVGFAELGYIGGLLLAGGNATEVVGAVLLFRFLTYFVQIPIGALTLMAWRGQHEEHAVPVFSERS